MTAPSVYSELADILLGLEAEMRRLDLWSQVPPDAEALASTQPFCIDTLDFHEWLQFIFLERMKIIIEANAPLPPVSGILPMAEECYKYELQKMVELMDLLKLFDEVISRHHGAVAGN